MQNKLEKLFNNFDAIYDWGIATEYMGGITEGRSIFVNKNLKIVNRGKLQPFKVTPKDAGGFQYIRLEIEGKKLFVGEVHGKTHPGNKLDTPERLGQSEMIINFLKNIQGAKIVGGDFNLMPETESIRLLESAGYKNLIKEFDIKSTRNKVSWEEFKNQPGFVKQRFADYVFVSPEVKVKSFEVPYLEVSDHLPLILEFDLPAGGARI